MRLFNQRGRTKTSKGKSLGQSLTCDNHEQTSFSKIEGAIDEVIKLENRIYEIVDEYADSLEDLPIAIETYPNLSLPLHKEFAKAAVEAINYNKNVFSISVNLQKMVDEVGKYNTFTEAQYIEIEDWIERFSNIKNDFASNYSSIMNLIQSLNQMKVLNFLVTSSKKEFIKTQIKLCKTLKKVIGIYASVVVKCKNIIKGATCIKNVEDDLDYSNVNSEFCIDCEVDEFNIDGMPGHDFEVFCAELLRKSGFSEVNITPGSGDQGVDILAMKEGIKFAIQCKNYATPLGNTPIQEVNAGKVFYNCHVGVVMTNSTFTKGASDLAIATGVLLWDGEMVRRMILRANDN